MTPGSIKTLETLSKHKGEPVIIFVKKLMDPCMGRYEFHDDKAVVISMPGARNTMTVKRSDIHMIVPSSVVRIALEKGGG